MSVRVPFERFLAWEQTTHDTIDFKKIYVDMAGDLVSGLMLSQIVFWHLPNRQGESKLRVQRGGHLWIVRKRTDWWEDCRITPKQADRGLAILEERGLIVTELGKFNGAPMKHLRINEAGFIAIWEETLEGISILTKGAIPIPQEGKWISTEGEDPFPPDRQVDLDHPDNSLLPEITTETTPERSFERDQQVVAELVLGISREFGDTAPERSIQTRALRIWKRSRLPVSEFSEIVYQARATTRLYQGKQQAGGAIRSKPAYFFEVLESLVRLNERG
ncbi:MAG: hypothetical protein H0V47_05025 [Chloroflexia bacterium]|nr:hypothetical protein [Chloroflexia bacterium]